MLAPQEVHPQKVTNKRFSLAGLTNWSVDSPKVEPLNLDKVSQVSECVVNSPQF